MHNFPWHAHLSLLQRHAHESPLMIWTLSSKNYIFLPFFKDFFLAKRHGIFTHMQSRKLRNTREIWKKRKEAKICTYSSLRKKRSLLLIWQIRVCLNGTETISPPALSTYFRPLRKKLVFAMPLFLFSPFQVRHLCLIAQEELFHNTWEVKRPFLNMKRYCGKGKKDVLAFFCSGLFLRSEGSFHSMPSRNKMRRLFQPLGLCSWGIFFLGSWADLQLYTQPDILHLVFQA